jgi:hypothetical protein
MVVAAPRRFFCMSHGNSDGLRSIPGVRLYCCESMGNHLPTITMNLDGFEAAHLGTTLFRSEGTDGEPHGPMNLNRSQLAVRQRGAARLQHRRLDSS